MYRATRSRILGFLIFGLTSPLVLGQGYAPDEAVKKMTVAGDLELSLVAAEPLVRQPVCIEFDDRGRLWVIQYLQYPNPAGLQRAKVDRFSRTTYDRIPEPPPHGPRGADRITILEDKDGDGIADSSHDFLDGLNLATGLAFGYGGVFVMQAPYLLFYPDKNQDDIPDGDPDVLVTGFGMDDAHSVANSLTWGPDGWLYGCQGSTVTAKIDGIEFQQGVWRYHPLRKKFELFCEGGGNSWGLDFDRHGRLLYGTNNGGSRLLHAVPGAYYWKSFGKHGPLHNPFAYGYFDHAPHQGFRGGHVTVGGIVYQGGGLPERYRDKYLFADTLGHQMLWDHIESRGSTVKTSNGGDLAAGNDTWFAPCDVTTGPDGAVYFCDWYDARMAHPDPDAEWDRRNGRIYRLRSRLRLADQSPRAATPDWPQLTTAKLITFHADSNNWIVRRARRVITERRDPEAILSLQTQTLAAADDQLALECFWTLASCGGLTEKSCPTFLSQRNPHIRRWAVQFLGDEGRLPKSTLKTLVDMAADETDAEVRTLLACTARRLPSDQALPILTQLLKQDLDFDDPYQSLLLWWAIETHSLPARLDLVSQLCSTSGHESSLAKKVIVPRLIRRYAAEGTELGLLSAGELLFFLHRSTDHEPLFAGLELGLSEAERPLNLSWDKLPTRLKFAWESVWKNDTVNSTLLRLGLRFHLPEAEQRTRQLISSQEFPREVRQQAMKNFSELAGTRAVEPLLSILENEKESDPLRLAAIDNLQRYRDDRVRNAWLAMYPSSSGTIQQRLAQGLLSRPEWATVFLGELLAQQLPVNNLKAEDWQNVIAELDDATRDLVVKTWGSVAPPTAEDRLAEIRRLNNDLRAGNGDLRSGQQLFTQHCAICHKLHGEGFQVGPDLTHANRKDRDYLLVQMVDPNAIIRKEYLSYSLATIDGRVLTGLLVNQNAAELTLMAAKEVKTTVPLSDVDELKESKASLMPENLLKQLKPQELRDLFAFLQQ